MNLNMPEMNKQEAHHCVKCGKQLASNAIICIDCGTNQITGKSLVTVTEAPSGATGAAENTFNPRTNALKKAGQRNMLVGALWCIGGIIVTAVTYLAASNSPTGGTYMVTWGAIIFGAIQFFRGLAQVFRGLAQASDDKEDLSRQPPLCVKCGKQLASNAIICIDCGTNQRTGKSLGTKTTTEPPLKVGDSGNRFITGKPKSILRFIVVAITMVAGFVGIFYYDYTERTKPLPAFNDLKPIPAQGLQYSLSRKKGQHAFEFTDHTGHRYQTDYFDPPVYEAILQHLRSGDVTLYTGQWKSAFKNSRISSVYQITAANSILVDYRTLALAKDKQQGIAWPLIIVLPVFVVAMVAWMARRMKEQLEAILGVIVHPKQTMQALPANRIFLLAFLSPFYFGISRAFRPGNHEVLLNALGGNWQIVLAGGLQALVMIPVGAWLMRQFLKLFKKRLSVRKIMNINGYADVPRLAVALIGYVIMCMNPAIVASERPTPGLITIIVLGVIGIAYTLFLNIYGVVVCPSEDKDDRNVVIDPGSLISSDLPPPRTPSASSKEVRPTPRISPRIARVAGSLTIVLILFGWMGTQPFID